LQPVNAIATHNTSDFASAPQTQHVPALVCTASIGLFYHIISLSD